MVLAVLMTVSSSLLLYGSGLLAFFTPIPFSILLYKKGNAAAAVSFILSLALLFLAYRVNVFSFLPGMVLYPHFTLSNIRLFSLFSFSYYALLGLLMTRMGHRRQSQTWGFGVAKILFPTLGLLFLAVLALTHLSLSNLLMEMKEGLVFVMGRLFEQNPQLTPEERNLIQGVLLDTIWHLAPAIGITLSLVIIAVNVLLLRRWVSRDFFSTWGDFILWRPKEQWIWAPLIAGVAYFANFYGPRNGVVSWGLLNLLLVIGASYFFQGLALFYFFLQRWLSPWARMFTLLFLFSFFQPLALLLVLVGLFDFWFDFRKVKRIGKGP